MRIKSDFKDYYDYVQRFGQDAKLLFLRRQQEKTLKQYPFPCIDPSPMLTVPLVKRCVLRPSVEVEEFMVGFCGVLYPGFELRTERKTTTATDYDSHYASQYCYTIEDIDQFLGEHRSPKFMEYYVHSANSRDKYEHSFRKQTGYYDVFRHQYEAVFAQTQKVRASTFFQEYGPIFLIRNGRYSDDHVLVINPCLREIRFFLRMPTAQAYQELEMCLGAQAAPHRPIPPVSDKDMATAKGFDQWSFRQQGPKPRKVKRR